MSESKINHETMVANGLRSDLAEARNRIAALEAKVTALEAELEGCRTSKFVAQTQRDTLRAQVVRLRKHLTHRTGAHKDPVAGCPGCEEDGDE